MFQLTFCVLLSLFHYKMSGRKFKTMPLLTYFVKKVILIESQCFKVSVWNLSSTCIKAKNK